MTSLYPGQKANQIVKRTEQKYQSAFQKLKRVEEETNGVAESYGKYQLQVMSQTVKSFIDFLEVIGQKASSKERNILDTYSFEPNKLKEYKGATLEAKNLLTGGVTAATASAATYGGALSVATTVGAASTGTAISTLSGAAAWNATLAWFGGGAIAAGGGGMAVGAAVLGGITALPALAVGGFMAKRSGEKALTKAKQYQAKAKKQIADMKSAEELAQRIQKRIKELHSILLSLNTFASEGLNKLSSQNFNAEKDAEQLHKVYSNIRAILEIIETPVLNKEGTLNLQTLKIIEKYKQYI